jgi:hypothetical protein
VQVVDAPGANVVTGHVGPELNATAGAACTSATDTPCKVTLPVLVTRNEYVITCPTVDTEDLSADFTIDRPGSGVAGTVTSDGVDGGMSVVEPGGVPVAVAESFTLPLSRSAWVTV